MAQSNPAPSLFDIQNSIFEAVRTGDSAICENWINEKPSDFTARERVQIYADGYVIRLEESLRDDFPTLARLLGPDLWSQFIESYVQSAPSNSFDLARAGDQLPHHLRMLGWTKIKSLHHEVADLELALLISGSAARAKLWDTHSLATLSPDEVEQLQLFLQPGVQLFKLTWNSDQLIQASAHKPQKAVSRVLVHRDGNQPKITSISDHEYDFLTLIAQRRTLGAIADQMGEQNWVQWLGQYAASGVIGVVS